ncbi:hypothetical protein COU75_02600 [Candidatus Peregrinibacteria bacterium CG10_big_fil_rev_8_21_14_0_10_42_8]|nr:MAG: hypothetical protein COU75_02600 [Candidatus Peregrinibacteria bacterium CG10_big_fil_rev_8_21_14_0_10_42_8]
MDPQYLAILLGGIIPAICFGLTGVFAKASTNTGIDIATYLLCVGATVLIDGIILSFFVTQRSYNIASCMYAAVVGLVWGVGIALFGYVLLAHKASVSAIVPFHGVSVLVAVLIALVVFAEWKTVNVPLLLLGSVFMVIGGVLVSRAQ